MPAVSMRPRRNARPGRTTFAAWFRRPISDSKVTFCARAARCLLLVGIHPAPNGGGYGRGSVGGGALREAGRKWWA